MTTVSTRADGRALLFAAMTAVLSLHPAVAEAQVAITYPAANAVLPAGRDFATDVLGDAWEMSNTADIAVDPAQKKGWANLGFTRDASNNGWVGGTLAPADGANNGSHINFLERAYWGILNPGRTGARFPIDSSVYTKLAFKMNSSRADQFPRVLWAHSDLGDPGFNSTGMCYVDPANPSPAGDQIFVVDLSTAPNSGAAWAAREVRGFGLYPNSSAVGYNVMFDWVRLTTGDSQPTAAMQLITWSGASGSATIRVTDSGGTTTTIASGISGTSYNWNYGVLPPGTYTLQVTQGVSVSPSVRFRINAPPTLTITSPDATGGEDFATAVLGNPWNMNDPANVRVDPATIVDHLISRTFSGGQFHGRSDGQVVSTTPGGIPVGDPQVYLLSNNGVIDTTRYRYLTFGLQVDGLYNLERGSVARVFWGSATGPGAPYNLTMSKDIIIWPGMNTYTIDLAPLSTAPTGGLETAGAATPWTTNNVRHLRIDPHEFAESRDFHFGPVKLASMNETTAASFTIRYSAADADGDPISLSLYYDTDTNPDNGKTLIASGVSPASGQYTWSTSAVTPGVYYIYAVASDGRNAAGTYSTGPIRVSTYIPLSNPQMSLDSPASGATAGQALQVSGWALDLTASSGTGVDAVHVYAYPNPGSGQPAIPLGSAAYGQSRGDVGAAFGSQFTNTGFTLQANLAPGPYLVAVYAHSTVSGSFQLRTASVTVASGTMMSIDQPAPGAPRQQPFTLSGWAIDYTAPSGPGVNTVHIWAYPSPGSGQSPVFVGVGTYGLSRPDVGSAFGARFTNSGYTLQVKGLPPQVYQFVVFPLSTATGTFSTPRTVTLPVQNAPAMAIDTPIGGTSSSSFTIGGWALDRAAADGTGVDEIHVWAYKNPGSGTPPQPLGKATYGGARGDVAAAFGNSQFTASGYSLPVSGLASGTYDIVVFAHSRVSGTFDNPKVVRITVP